MIPWLFVDNIGVAENLGGIESFVCWDWIAGWSVRIAHHLEPLFEKTLLPLVDLKISESSQESSCQKSRDRKGVNNKVAQRIYQDVVSSSERILEHRLRADRINIKQK